jgi:hypothetical protein
MTNFSEGLMPEFAGEIGIYSRAIYTLREARTYLLKTYGVAGEDELLAQIRAGKVAEHPAYEHYLSMKVLAGTTEDVRAELDERLRSM